MKSTEDRFLNSIIPETDVICFFKYNFATVLKILKLFLS